MAGHRIVGSPFEMQKSDAADDIMEEPFDDPWTAGDTIGTMERSPCGSSGSMP